MRIRGKETYLSTDVWRACHLLAQARGTQTDEQGLARTTTADEVADIMLREIISEKYPQISEHLWQVKKLEAEFIKTLGGGK